MAKRKSSSFLANPGQVEPRWFVVDAADRVLGRLASDIAMILMGKHKPTYTPHVDTGDFVVVLNAEKVRLTGNKANTMTYARYSYHPGGRKEVPYKQMIARHPERVLFEAVRRMMPKNALGQRMLKKLKVYAGDQHPHIAQQPEPLTAV